MMSPTARTLALLRSQGYHADVVEKWLPGGRVRRDWGGWGDVLAAGDRGILMVQATTKPHISDRVRKAVSLLSLVKWLRGGGRAEVWGWYCTGPGPVGKQTWFVEAVNLGLALDAAQGKCPCPARLTRIGFHRAECLESRR